MTGVRINVPVFLYICIAGGGICFRLFIKPGRRKHRRNLNTLVIGGSGAGKTRFFCKPNIMQTNTSLVILDPKGEQIRDCGYLLETEGYEVKGTWNILPLRKEKTDSSNRSEISLKPAG